MAVRFKSECPSLRVVALDNLKRRGSELNLPRVREHEVEFIHCDIRSPEDLNAVGPFDCIIECSAEPGADKESNWLPAPKVPFNLTMRLYAPKPEILVGKWNPPPVVRVQELPMVTGGQ